MSLLESPPSAADFSAVTVRHSGLENPREVPHDRARHEILAPDSGLPPIPRQIAVRRFQFPVRPYRSECGARRGGIFLLQRCLQVTAKKERPCTTWPFAPFGCNPVRGRSPACRRLPVPCHRTWRSAARFPAGDPLRLLALLLREAPRKAPCRGPEEGLLPPGAAHAIRTTCARAHSRPDRAQARPPNRER